MREDGLFCEPSGCYIDPWQPVDCAVITHAHAGHARPGHARYLAAREGERVLRVNFPGSDFAVGACLQRNLRRRCQYSGYGCLLLCLALLLTACGSKVRLPPLAEDAVILAFGDSLTYGTGANEAESYPAVLEGLIKRKVVAAGIPGETSAEGLARLADELESVEPRLLMLCHGGNDLLRRSGEAAAEANLRAMVRLARERGIDVVLIGVPRPGVRLAAAGFYEKIAADNGLVILRDALADILGDNALKADLTHPNAAGYRKLAREIAALLKRAGAV